MDAAAVSFDLDGTICVAGLSDREFVDAVYDRAGVDPLVSPRELRAVDTDRIERAGDRWPTPSEPPLAAFYTSLFRAAVDQHDVDLVPDDPLVADLGRVAGELYDPTAVRFRAGAEAALEHVVERYPVGLVTNGERDVQASKLDALGIAGLFDVTVFCSPEHGVPTKPATNPFERAVEGLSAAPSRTVHVGDSHAEDVVGALDAGLAAIWAPTDRPHEEPPVEPHPAPTARVDSLEAIRSLL